MITDITSSYIVVLLFDKLLIVCCQGYSAFAQRQFEEETELESDEKDRQHAYEREEIKVLRLNMMKN